MSEERLETINYKGHPIKVGYPVRVLPSKKGGRDGFDSLAKSFRGHVVEGPDGTKRGKVTSVEVYDPEHRSTRHFGPERIVPYLRNVAAKVEALTPKNVVPIGSAKKTAPKAPATKAASTRRAAEAIKKAAAATKTTGAK